LRRKTEHRVVAKKEAALQMMGVAVTMLLIVVVTFENVVYD
jgi:hypothetical protein